MEPEVARPAFVLEDCEGTPRDGSLVAPRKNLRGIHLPRQESRPFRIRQRIESGRLEADQQTRRNTVHRSHKQDGGDHVPSSFPVPPLQVLLAKKYAQKSGEMWNKADERAPLKLSVDPEHELLAPFIKKGEPLKKGNSIYEEVDPQTYLSLYGAKLPTKIEAWNVGPAEFKPRFTPETLQQPKSA
ncbi:hypothetical protein L596_011352 [Steinernema carpocapsae]|uniref:Uncharacterized protein n=1 Tax=Steinernema carpocapsae TaxID=34508 RepID=A0A4U5NUK1_STECR|nr:hypothetical protein L596_011352 [Steinernema carpocapsae]